MSAVAIVRALLLAHEPILALVPAARIVAGTVPAGALPAIGITEVGGNEHDTVARAGNSLVTSRVQVTVYASSYPQQKAVLKAAKLGAGVHTGPIAGCAVRSVLRDLIGPDMGDDAIPTFEQSRDFMVTYIEPI
ncbi:hypothetical protein CR152_30045 [Massilia violaceinigra]|uniref:DUF3168 domain-containing protein n=1 Tax=Massilia violaceinigra TaxID=2045208 RepID=A0A2D2DTH3_9BURK|nr:hypothetical protein [Massilia violaceinigra]ATQ78279.1 hypothetical protein CR152_30045 [Massilia violaceinigra]